MLRFERSGSNRLAQFIKLEWHIPEGGVLESDESNQVGKSSTGTLSRQNASVYIRIISFENSSEGCQDYCGHKSPNEPKQIRVVETVQLYRVEIE